jgi:hypothetical protein
VFSFTTFKVGILSYRDDKPIGTCGGYGTALRAVDGANGLYCERDNCLSGEEGAIYAARQTHLNRLRTTTGTALTLQDKTESLAPLWWTADGSYDPAI